MGATKSNKKSVVGGFIHWDIIFAGCTASWMAGGLLEKTPIALRPRYLLRNYLPMEKQLLSLAQCRFLKNGTHSVLLNLRIGTHGQVI